MGTNYYLRIDPCKYCGRSDESIHIGKQSYGWNFSFNANGWCYFKTIKELKKWLKSGKIYDENGEKVSVKKFWENIERTQKVKEPKLSQEDMQSLRSTMLEGYKFHDCEFS